MEYDDIPEELDDNEVVIYEDNEGNIEIDRYLTKDDAEDLKQFLLLKFKNVYYAKDPESFDVNRPFRPNKPFVMKRQVREVDWLNPQVIKTLIMSRDIDSQALATELVRISGKVAVENSLATGMTPEMQYRKYDVVFQKWLYENNKVVTTANKESLVDEWSKSYIAEQKLKRQKRVQVGTRVLCYDTKKVGVVVEYVEEDGEYRIETDDGTSRYKRKGFEVVSDGQN